MIKRICDHCKEEIEPKQYQRLRVDIKRPYHSDWCTIREWDLHPACFDIVLKPVSRAVQDVMNEQTSPES